MRNILFFILILIPAISFSQVIRNRPAGVKQVMNWTGSTPNFHRYFYNNVSTTTDGSGDITVTHNLPNASFAATVTITGTTAYTAQIHTKGASNFKVRIFDMAGNAVTNTAVTFDWIAWDN